MDNLQKKFIEEATDNINDLEDALLLIEKKPKSKELIERIFRTLHTLKGTGAMFGFDNISEITHDLENIYDLLRTGKKQLDRDILDITLQSVDHLRNLLTDIGFSNNENIKQHEQLLINISGLVKGNFDDKVHSSDQINDTDTYHTYYIHFEPAKELLIHGNNPLYLLDELADMGEILTFINTQHIPDLETINPEHCYISFEILLSSKSNINDIFDVFIFVEDECKLDVKKLTDHNIFENKQLINKLNNLKTKLQESYYTDIQKLINTELAYSINNETGYIKNKKENIISSIRVASEKLDSLMNLVSELVTTQARLHLYAENNGQPELIAISENVQKISRQLRDIAFEIVLIPIETIITRFQRLVRDLSNELNKKVKFITEGTDTELDKTIIENLTDPLLHILRNCLDHGIESPKERRRKKKPEEGTILFKSYYSGTNVVIDITDDGSGIDPDRIKNYAIKNGFITDDLNLDKSDIYDLLFMPGFSTSEKITDVSGRGVGMDVVKRKISEVRGEIKINSEINVGTTFTIILPLTLSIIDGLLIKISDIHYIIPLSSVDKIYAVSHQDILSAFNNHIKLDGNLYPFFNLRKEFNVTDATVLEQEQIIVVQYQDKKVGVLVDSVIGEYQAVLKPLGKHYKNQQMISGASILGDGTVALVMDTNKLINYITNHNIKLEETNNE